MQPMGSGAPAPVEGEEGVYICDAERGTVGDRKQERKCLLSKISKMHWCFQSIFLVAQMVKSLSAM